MSQKLRTFRMGSTDHRGKEQGRYSASARRRSQRAREKAQEAAEEGQEAGADGHKLVFLGLAGFGRVASLKGITKPCLRVENFEGGGLRGRTSCDRTRPQLTATMPPLPVD